jgi:hypothetical protein
VAKGKKRGKGEEDAPRDPKDKSKRLPRALRPKGQLEKRPRRVRPTEHIVCFVCRGDPDMNIKPQHVHDFDWNGCKCRHPNHGLPKNKR